MPRNPAINQGGRRRKGKARKTHPEEIVRADRIARILQLRIQGWSLKEIGESEKISIKRVHVIVVKTLTETVQEPAEELRKLENFRLDALQVRQFEKAAEGDGWAVDRCLAIQERRAKLNGLDAPTKIDNPGAAGPVQIVFNISQDDANL